MKTKTKMSIEEAHSKGYVGTTATVFADKISIVLPHPNTFMKDSTLNGGTENYAELLHKQAFQMLNDEMVAEQLSKKLGHKIAFKLKLDYSDELVCVYLLPKTGTNCMRLEFNPQKIGALGLSELAAYLDSMLIDECWNMIRLFGHVTRVDSTIDLWGVDIEQVWATYKKMRQTFAVKQNGRFQTMAFGSVSKPQMKIYDKVAHLGLDVDCPITRIEHKWVGPMRVKDLHKMANPFLGLTVTDKIPAKPTNGIKPWDWTMFCDSVKVRGPLAALATLPLHRRKKYRQHIEAQAIPFWQPEKFWASWPKVAAEIQSAGEYLSNFKQAA